MGWFKNIFGKTKDQYEKQRDVNDNAKELYEKAVKRYEARNPPNRGPSRKSQILPEQGSSNTSTTVCPQCSETIKGALNRESGVITCPVCRFNFQESSHVTQPEEIANVKKLLRERPDFLAITIRKEGANLEGRFGLSREGQQQITQFAKELANEREQKNQPKTNLSQSKEFPTAKGLMGEKVSSAAHSGDVALNEHVKVDDLAILFNHHLNELRTQTSSKKKMRCVLDELERTWNFYSLAILKKVQTTLSDRQIHSIFVTLGESEVSLNVYAIPVPLRDARNYFTRGTPATYTEVIGNMMKSPAIIMAKENGAKVLVHIVVCAPPNNSPLAINSCIIPHLGSGPDYIIVLPTDLLTDVEREVWEQNFRSHTD